MSKEHEYRTLEPIRLSGWYEHTDGTIGRYVWAESKSGPLLVRVVRGWSEAAACDAERERLLNS